MGYWYRRDDPLQQKLIEFLFCLLTGIGRALNQLINIYGTHMPNQHDLGNGTKPR